MEAVTKLNGLVNGKTMTSCATCALSFSNIIRPDEETVKYFLDQIFRGISSPTHSPVEVNNNSILSGQKTGDKRPVSAADISIEIGSIAEGFNKSLGDIKSMVDLLVKNIHHEAARLVEELKTNHRESLLQMSEFVEIAEFDTEDKDELRLLIQEELSVILSEDTLQEVEEEPEVLQQSPIPLETVDVKLSGEGHVAIQDLIVMTYEGQKTIVVSDYMNRCVKCIYLDERQTDVLEFDQPPFYLTQSTNTTAAVTFGRVKKIGVFQITPELCLQRMIETQIEYSGIQGLSASTFAASRACAFKNGIIDIIDSTGTVLRSFGTNILAAPYFIGIAGCGRIIVSDSTERSVICFTSKGQIRFMYRPTDENMLSCPRGLKHYKDSIFVVDEDGNKVVQLTEKGEFVRDILTSNDSLDVPRAIDVDEDGCMYVSVHERYIKIFKVP